MAVQNNSYYDNLKNESYKAMLDSEIQASVARDQAMKYTQNQVNAMGYGQQGLAQSSMVGIQNNYRNALADAAKQYQSDLMGINEQQNNAGVVQDNTDFQSVTALMSGATSKEQLNKIYNAYKDDDTLSPNSKKQLELLYGMYSSDYEQQELSNAQFDITAQNATVTNQEGKAVSVDTNKEFSAEKTTLQNAINTNVMPNDSYVHLKTEKGYNLYLRYYNGNLYYVSKEDYDNSTNTYHIFGYENIKTGNK